MEEWNRGRLLETSGYFWQTCALHASVRLDVYSIIGGGAVKKDELAERTGCDERALGMLLNALAAMKLLLKKNGAYENTDVGWKFLSKESPEYIGHMIMHHRDLVRSWSRLDEAVKNGRPVRARPSFDNDETRESFLMGMFNLATGIAPGLTSQIDLSGRRKFLDLGGGPGTYAIHFCLANPELEAVIFDLPTTKPFAEKIIQRFDVGNRVSFMAGDYLKDEIRGEYDVAWLSHILHGEGPEDCAEIVRKTAASVKPGGIIMIHEFILDDTMDGPLFPALFSLNMLLGTQCGQAYSEEQISDMLASAGVREIRRLSFNGPNESGIIKGTV